MTKGQAMVVAESVREAQEVPRGARLFSTEQQYVELAEGDPEQPSPVRDVLAWLVRFEFEKGRWVELAVDDKQGQVVRVRRSR